MIYSRLEQQSSALTAQQLGSEDIIESADA